MERITLPTLRNGKTRDLWRRVHRYLAYGESVIVVQAKRSVLLRRFGNVVRIAHSYEPTIGDTPMPWRDLFHFSEPVTPPQGARLRPCPPHDGP